MRNRMVAAAPAVVAALAVFPMLALVLLRGVDIPYWDEWAWVRLIHSAHVHTLTLADVWRPHNEHRMFVPNLIMLALDRLGGWNVVREQVVSVAMLAATQLAIWLLIRRTIVPRLQGLTFLAATALLFGLTQYENLEWGFQMAWFLCNLGMVVAVWALAQPQRGAREIAIAIGAATIASLSSSQGLASWVAGAVVIVLLPRRSPRALLVWVGAAIAVAALARYGVQSAADSGGATQSSPLHLLEYFLAYLGSPLAGSFGTGYAIAAGAALTVWTVVLVTAAWKEPASTRSLLVPWLAIIAYVLVCALLTAAGRGGNDMSQALSSRYTSVASLAWLAVVVATVASLQTMRRRAMLQAAPIALVLALSFTQDVSGDAQWRQHASVLSVARDQLSRGDIGGIAAVYPEPARFVALLGDLYDIHDGLFNGP